GGCPPIIPGDFDRDGDIANDDYARFLSCLLGPDVPQSDPDCIRAIIDGDLDVDHRDFAAFQNCFRGAGVPADAACGK
ncbi:MAG: hypothetical protein Q7R41_16790, partial [Phycisphaerales bacterium]|nr:hypothetical protein [Phycisphaerales bacterium]